MQTKLGSIRQTLSVYQVRYGFASRFSSYFPYICIALYFLSLLFSSVWAIMQWKRAFQDLSYKRSPFILHDLSRNYISFHEVMRPTCYLVRQMKLQRLSVWLSRHASKNRPCYTRPYCAKLAFTKFESLQSCAAKNLELWEQVVCHLAAFNQHNIVLTKNF